MVGSWHERRLRLFALVDRCLFKSERIVGLSLKCLVLLAITYLMPTERWRYFSWARVRPYWLTLQMAVRWVLVEWLNGLGKPLELVRGLLKLRTQWRYNGDVIKTHSNVSQLVSRFGMFGIKPSIVLSTQSKGQRLGPFRRPVGGG